MKELYQSYQLYQLYQLYQSLIEERYLVLSTINTNKFTQPQYSNCGTSKLRKNHKRNKKK